MIKWLALLPLMLTSFIPFLSATEKPYPLSKDKIEAWRLPEVPYPESNSNKKAVEELGKQLFFDPRLTGNRTLSCATCHFPGTGWSDPLPNKAENTRDMDRQAPSLINIAFQRVFFWDGRSKTLEKAIRFHLKELSATRSDIPALPDAYQEKFQRAFDSSSTSSENIAKAIANFLRTIVVKDSPFDRWLAGDKSALSQSAKQGFLLFAGKAECSRCHSTPNFSDSKFHNIGLNTLDPGRLDISGKSADKNRFRTPSLRQISRTSPYMHMGNKKNLISVIEFYSRGGDRHEKENELTVLNLTEQEEGELLDFLMSLTGSNTSIAIPQLPVSGAP
ncbi:MAG: cytochrome c peroxidase [Mariprofundaceae bacterium]